MLNQGQFYFLNEGPTSVSYFFHLFIWSPVHHKPYLRNRAYNHDFWYTSVNDNISRLFFISKFWLSVLPGDKRAKNSPKWQKFCLSHLISQESYIIWSLFIVHMCMSLLMKKKKNRNSLNNQVISTSDISFLLLFWWWTNN